MTTNITPVPAPQLAAPTTMRAAVIGSAGPDARFSTAEVPFPTRVNAEAIVRIHAASVNPIDAKTRAGRGNAPALSSFPAVIGKDFSGVVVAAPYETCPFPVGTEVYGVSDTPRNSGSYAEYVSVPLGHLARKPQTLSHRDAACVPLAALTAWGMVIETAKAREGQRILIHGASGGVGHFAVQLAHYFGATVIATTSTKNIEFVKSLGAREVIDYTKTRFEDAVPQPVDVVIDLIGNVAENTGTRSLAVLRRGGLIVNAPSGSWPSLLADAAEYGVRGTHFQVSPEGSTLSVLTRLLDAGDIRVRVRPGVAASGPRSCRCWARPGQARHPRALALACCGRLRSGQR